MENLIIIGMVIYWLPIYLYLIFWSLKIRWYVRKHNIESLDTTSPVTYKKGRLTDFQLLGEVLMYGISMFCGIFTFLVLPKNMIKDSILPDS
jgi:hypothetical protein